jgi:hypothetical protein
MSGVLLTRIIDKWDGQKLFRVKSNETLLIENNTIVNTTNTINFNYLEKAKIKHLAWIPNNNIGVIDF